MKILIKTIIGLFIFFPFITFASVEGCNPVWSIEDVSVDETNQSTSLALYEGEKKAASLAFNLLLDRILVNPSAIESLMLQNLKLDIDGMVDFKLIKSETTLSNRYIANFSFCFLPNKVSNFLTSNNLSWSELKSRPILIIPVWKHKFGSHLWTDPNPWRKSFSLSLDKFNGLSQQVLPQGRIGIERSIDSKLALNGNEESISRAIARGGASRAIITVAEIISSEPTNHAAEAGKLKNKLNSSALF